MKIRLLKKFYVAASSKWLALGLMAYAVLLIFIATLAQREIGVAAAQAKYFESVFCLGDFFGVKIPLLAGAGLGFLAVINLIASGWRYVSGGLRGFGESITHMALVLLIVSGGLQYFMRTEGSIVLREGATINTVIVGAKNGSLGSPITLPFEITLKSFNAEMYESSSTPRSFTSVVEFLRGGKIHKAEISMNSPASFGGWTFYQMSYADNGKASVLGAVRNPARLLPWLAVGATFFGMLIIFIPRVISNGRRKDYE